MKLYLFLLLTLTYSCSSLKVTDYKKAEPKLNLKEFFQGKIKAKGIVQDRSRKVIKRFDVDIIATSPQKNIIKLDESFVYSDKTTSKRVWTLKEMAPNNFEASAADVIGKAKGQTAGNTFYFEYTLEIPVDGTIYHINLEDWMILLDKKTLMARSYMSKWGFDIGEITIIMQKE